MRHHPAFSLDPEGGGGGGGAGGVRMSPEETLLIYQQQSRAEQRPRAAERRNPADFKGGELVLRSPNTFSVSGGEGGGIEGEGNPRKLLTEPIQTFSVQCRTDYRRWHICVERPSSELLQFRPEFCRNTSKYKPTSLSI